MDIEECHLRPFYSYSLS